MPAVAQTLEIVPDSELEPRGTIQVALFAGEEAYRKEQATQFVEFEPAQALRISNVEPGEYAIALFQDVDGDGELSKHALGYPTEPYGFSGNKGRFGRPKWKKVRFEIRAAESIQPVLVPIQRW